MRLLICSLLLLLANFTWAEDGYRLWLRYSKIINISILQQYSTHLTSFHISGSSPTLQAAEYELRIGLDNLLDKKIPVTKSTTDAALLVFSKSNSTKIPIDLKIDYSALGQEGFAIQSILSGKKNIKIITANTDIGILYGVFHFLRILQSNQNIQNLSIISIPKIKNRILNHWDNLNRTVERGYAGYSIWNWHQLPDYIDQRYIDYARANASIGINGTVLTNVNANALVLTPSYLAKVQALADVFRPYGIKIFLTARFSAPIEIGGLKTADPLDSTVRNWWNEKTKEIYQYIPDFGGFLIKANSEGQPGPQNYDRSHADGANLLADAVAPFGGIVMWRAFVYSNEVPDDRVKQAFNEFKPLDGKFRKNVLIQVKNGPLDFQPREPFHPLFGAMTQTPLMTEFQLTLEYLGQGTHLVYEAPLFKEVLDADTYHHGKGTTITKIINGSTYNYLTTGIAGVANIGNERNWTGHPFGQANWYVFGRLAWDQDLNSQDLAEEWIRQTFTNSKSGVSTIKKMMMASREAVVNYMTPLGLHHIMGTGHHYGPAPWISNAGRADWNPVYYHRADSMGIGFNRTASGSNALSQYASEVRQQYESMQTCPDEYLLWFHHVPWTHKMKSGRTLLEELCMKYKEGVDTVKWMKSQWNSVQGLIDDERFQQMKMFLSIQEKDAVWWRNACLLYFQTFSKMPFPTNYEKPNQTLEHYRSLKFPYAPGNGQ